MDEQINFKISAKTILLYRLRIIILAAIIAFISGGIMAFFTFWGALINIFVFFMLAISFFWYPALLYKNYSVAITGENLCITKGLFLMRKYCTNTTNICYISKITTPLQNVLGIFSLCLYTRSGKLYISNIENIPDIFRGFINE